MLKIFRGLAVFALLFALASGARAQTITTVTGTVVDPNGIPYSFAPATINLVPSPGTPSPTITATGAPVVMPINPTTNFAGAFSVNLIANGSISSAGSTYTFRVCSAPVAPPIGTGTGNSCVTITGVTIAGASQDLSATFAAVPPPALTNVTNQSRVYNTPAPAGNTAVAPITILTVPVQPAGGTRYVFSPYVTQTVLGVTCAGNSIITVNIISQDPNAAAPQTTPVGLFTVTGVGTLGIVPQVGAPGATQALLVNGTFLAKAGSVVQWSASAPTGGGCTTVPTVQIFALLEIQ